MEGEREIERKTNSKDGPSFMDRCREYFLEWIRGETPTDTFEVVTATAVRSTTAADSCRFAGFPGVAGTLLD